MNIQQPPRDLVGDLLAHWPRNERFPALSAKENTLQIKLLP